MKGLRNHRGQGMTEYIVILGVIVAIAVGILWNKFNPALQSKVDGIINSLKT